MKEYSSIDGQEMIRQMASRIARLERGTAKSRVPTFATDPGPEAVDGAQFYVVQGELRVRIGESNYSVSLTEL